MECRGAGQSHRRVSNWTAGLGPTSISGIASRRDRTGSRSDASTADSSAADSARRRFLVDISPLQESRDYRLLFTGQAVTFVARQVTLVATQVQVYALTGSSVMVGLLSLAQFPLLLFGSLLGGTLADAHDRRRLLIATNLATAAASVGLAVNASTAGGGRLWPLFVCTALQAGIGGIDAPTRSAATPALVGVRHITAASALNQILFQVGGVAGPALAGVLVAWVSIAAAFWTEVGAFGVALFLLVGLRPLPPHGGGVRPGLRSIGEGLRFLRGRRALQGTFVIDVNAMVFGMPRALFPELAARQFGGGAQTVGLLNAAPGAGAMLGAIASGWTNRVERPGRAVLWAVGAWGLAIAAFGLSPWLPLALMCLALAGWADVISAVFRNTILQLSVPDRLRGRLSAVHIAVVAGGPRLGDAEAGAVAAVTSPRFSAVSGGVACMVGVGVIARLLPALGRWTRDDAHTEPATRPDPTETDPTHPDPTPPDPTRPDRTRPDPTGPGVGSASAVGDMPPEPAD